MGREKTVEGRANPSYSEKLLDSYLELSEEERSSLQTLEKSLVERCSLTKDLLVAGKQFTTRRQG